MKKAGIIGGIGPASTLDYYSGIVRGYRLKADDGHYPELIIHSIDMTEMLSHLVNRDLDALAEMLICTIERLVAAGAEFAAIASNTPHIVFDRIKKKSPLPVISIVEETCRYAQAKRCKKVIVMGTRFTMSSGLYTDAFNKYDIEAVVPSEDEQAAIHGIIFPNLEDGIVVPEDKRKMLEMANRLITEQHADALILGCTELPLMIKEGDLGTLIINITQVHINSIVNFIVQETHP